MYRVPVKTLCSITHRVMVRLLSGLTCTSETTGTCEQPPKHNAQPQTIKIRFITHLPKSLDERRLEVGNYYINSVIYSAVRLYSITFQPYNSWTMCLCIGLPNPGAGITCLGFTLSDFSGNVKGKVNARCVLFSGPAGYPLFLLSSSGLTRRSRKYQDFIYPGFPLSRDCVNKKLPVASFDAPPFPLLKTRITLYSPFEI